MLRRGHLFLTAGCTSFLWFLAYEIFWLLPHHSNIDSIGAVSALLVAGIVSGAVTGPTRALSSLLAVTASAGMVAAAVTLDLFQRPSEVPDILAGVSAVMVVGMTFPFVLAGMVVGAQGYRRFVRSRLTVGHR